MSSFLRLALCSWRLARPRSCRRRYRASDSWVQILTAVSICIEALRQGLRELGYVEGKTSSSSIAMPRTNSLSLPRARGRARAAQGRRHCHWRSGGDQSLQGRNDDDPHRDGTGYRSCGDRICQFGATRRQHYRTGNLRPGDQRQTTGTAQRDRAKNLGGGDPRYCEYSRAGANAEGGRNRRQRVGSDASLYRRTEPQGC